MSEDTELQVPDLLQTLKARADMMGVRYHPSISAEKLAEKINAKMNDQPDPTEEAAAPELIESVVKAETDAEKRNRLKREANTLVRVRITCMNPLKKEYQGEVFTAGNSVVGSFKKYVPFGVEWHVPRIIYKMLKARQFQTFTNDRTKNGVTVKKGKIVNEFSIELLDPLTPEELKDLAHVQAMAGSVQQ